MNEMYDVGGLIQFTNRGEVSAVSLTVSKRNGRRTISCCRQATTAIKDFTKSLGQHLPLIYLGEGSIQMALIGR